MGDVLFVVCTRACPALPQYVQGAHHVGIRFEATTFVDALENRPRRAVAFVPGLTVRAGDARFSRIDGKLKAQRSGVYLYQKQARKHNRQIHKCSILKGGVRKLNQSPYLVKGFRLFDKVMCLGQVGFIFGRRATGYFDVRTLGGKTLSPAIHIKKLTLLEKRKTFLTELRKENGAFFPV